MSEIAFTSTALKPALLDNLAGLGYHTMTQVQAESLPPILDGDDVIAQAKTGSGKTAAFALGLLNRLDVKRFRIQSLVLCPTRELADQVAREIRRLARSIHNIKVLTLCGGVPMGPQIGSLEHGAHIIVGTPGRIEDHLSRGRLKLDNLNCLVLDEADRMLEMGFAPALEMIVDHCPRQRQTLLFSATYPPQIEKMAQSVMQQPVMVKVASTHDQSSIRQHFYRVQDNSERLSGLQRVLHRFDPKSAVIFCTTKAQTDEVADELNRMGVSTLALHGDLEQRERDQALIQFANGSITVLVATDVAARGLDIEQLDLVINYHLAGDPEVHVHRVGRTGRAGSQGRAVTLLADKEAGKLARLEEYLDKTFAAEPLPDEAVLGKALTEAGMATLQIAGGKKQKLRAGDILGALTGKSGLSGKAKPIEGKQVGKIHLMDNHAYVAIERHAVRRAQQKLSEGKMKGRSFRVRHLGYLAGSERRMPAGDPWGNRG